MTLDEYLAEYPETPITPEQLVCCRYLERQGKRFLIDFGYVSAPGMVWDELDRAAEAEEDAIDLLVLEAVRNEPTISHSDLTGELERKGVTLTVQLKYKGRVKPLPLEEDV